MSAFRTRLVKMRALLACALGAAYVVGSLLLLLAFVTGDAVGALRVHGLGWLGWFGSQMALGLAAIWVYPYERPSRRPGANARWSRSGERLSPVGSPRS